MPDDVKTWRQALRDIPANYTESEYDEILARDADGNLTHPIWKVTQPHSSEPRALMVKTTTSTWRKS